MKSKDKIRAEIRDRRRMEVAERSSVLLRDSELICRRIEAMPAFRKAETVLSYSPMKGEVDVSLIDFSGKKVITADCGWDEIPAEAIDFAIIPGVAFAPAPDGKGFLRLGRGGGYYDRLIPLLHCRTVSPAFDFQVFDDLPCDPWDCRVDELVF